ncbi:MAG: lytic transglycosylase domain-containing protein [Sporomusaceae bacterium]|nr:lytic transglycosylase domain-containing protein [Sporomusaceae bacterium]
MLNGVAQVLNRIQTIEARFGVKPVQDDFAGQLSKAMNAGGKQPEAALDNSQDQVKQLVQTAALRHGVKPALAVAVARAESNFAADAVSPAGATGVMQLMPDTAKALGVSNAADVGENIDGGVRYLKQMLGLFNDERLAVAAYNAGPEAVKHYRGVPPYAETQNYVKKIFDEIADDK